jgi:hypothetical protein
MRRLGWLFLAVVTAGLVMNGISLYAILHAYPRPEVYETASLASLASPCLVLDEHAQLLAYEVSPPTVKGGQEISLSLTWFGLVDRHVEGKLAVEMLGRNDERLAQAEVVPSLRPDRISRDVVSLQVGNILLPTRGRLQLRLLDGAGNTLPVVTRNRHPADDVIALSPVKVVPAQPFVYVPKETVGARLGEAIALLGYDLPSAYVAPGSVLDLTLYWRAESSPSADYTVFVHLMDEDSTPVAQGDSPPDGGYYPTTMWEAGEQIRDRHVIPVPGETPPGRYRLGVGLYLPETWERLQAFDAQGELAAAGTIVLSEVLVTRP